MKYSFNVKFKIFDVYSSSEKQKAIREKLCEDLPLILQNSIRDNCDEYKYLFRCEPSICSIDEKKQLRMSLSSFMNVNTESQYIIFNQKSGEEIFTLEELTLLCKKIKKEIEEYLHYEIDAFIYINL